jgi:hypothetical protein
MSNEKEISEAHGFLTDLNVKPGTLVERIEFFRQRASNCAIRCNTMRTALDVIRSFNHLRDDKDAFLLEIVKFALGETDELPRPSDYGMEMEDIPDMLAFFDEDMRIVPVPKWGED